MKNETTIYINGTHKNKVKRIVPEHEEEFIVCDYCEEEINDYSYITCGGDGKPNKHFHSMKVGGSKGNVEKTCLELSGEELI